MKFGKQLKLQSVSAWQEQYMSYKRLKRIIKKLMVQLKEAEEKQIKEMHDQHAANANSATGSQNGKPTMSVTSASGSGKLTPEQIASRMAAGSPIQSYSPTLALSSASTPEGGVNKPAKGKSRLSLPGQESSPNVKSAGGSSPAMIGQDAYSEFFTVVDQDIEKVNKFFAAKYDELLYQYKMIEQGKDGSRSDSLGSGGGSERKGSGSKSGENSPDDSPSPSPDPDDATGGLSAGLQGSVAAVSAWMHGAKKRGLSNTSESSEPNYGALEHGEAGAADGADLKESAPLVAGKEAHTISTSQQKLVEEKCDKLLELYRLALHLQIYSLINYEGLRKIIKKFDKNTGEEHSEAYVARLDQEPFRDTSDVNALIAQIEELYTKFNCRRPNQDVWSSQSMLRGVKREVDNPKEEDEEGHELKWGYCLLALGVLVAMLLLPILPHDPRAQSCAALLGFITVLWVTEAVPFFVGALCIPFVTVMLGILADPSGVPLTADKASKAAFGFMFNDTIVLILGGFSISAAFSKCNFELRLAGVIQRFFGDSPRLFLLAFMLLGAFLSCWISNIAAPVLLTTLLLPIVRDFGSGSAYARSLLLGLAFACNIGGMMSPISSPQNAIALGYLEQTLPQQGITFSQWLCVSLPFCLVLVLLSWLYLIFVFLGGQSDVDSIPPIVFEKQPINRQQVTVIAVTVCTIVLWCTLSYTKGVFGEMGTIAVLPIVIFFGGGILNKNDLKGFSWHLILLIGGGNVLGAAVNSSQLLHIISQSLTPYLSGHSAYTTTITVLLAVFMVTTFVSHTVAALILTPIIVDIAASTGQVQVVCMLATLMMSGTMSLPMSSFPNVNSLLVDDDFGRPFLHAVDYLKQGSAVSIMVFAALASFGYVLAYAFLDHDSGDLSPMKGASHHAW